MNRAEIHEILMHGKAFSHPLRIEFLELAAKEPISPVVACKKHKLGNLDVVSYQATQLRGIGCLELARTRPRRGTIEHFWIATDRGLSVLRIAEEIVKSKPRGATPDHEQQT